MKRTHDSPVKSERPIAASIRKSSVEPVKPKAFSSGSPTTVPIMPPGASGSGVVRLCEAQVLDGGACGDKQQKPDASHHDGSPVDERGGFEPAVAPAHRIQQKQHEPVG